MVIKIKETGQGFKSFFAGMQEILRQVAQHQIEAQLEAEVEACLHRGYHAKRSGVHVAPMPDVSVAGHRKRVPFRAMVIANGRW